MHKKLFLIVFFVVCPLVASQHENKATIIYVPAGGTCQNCQWNWKIMPSCNNIEKDKAIYKVSPVLINNRNEGGVDYDKSAQELVLTGIKYDEPTSKLYSTITLRIKENLFRKQLSDISDDGEFIVIKLSDPTFQNQNNDKYLAIRKQLIKVYLPDKSISISRPVVNNQTTDNTKINELSWGTIFGIGAIGIGIIVAIYFKMRTK
ncbi:MAG TPA: hypothetical protein VLB80_05155 [Candidatus Babeliales bacterium]|nr:hypothetical protein [Candidatus Babeliales bacterium]